MTVLTYPKTMLLNGTALRDMVYVDYSEVTYVETPIAFMKRMEDPNVVGFCITFAGGTTEMVRMLVSEMHDSEMDDAIEEIIEFGFGKRHAVALHGMVRMYNYLMANLGESGLDIDEFEAGL